MVPDIVNDYRAFDTIRARYVDSGILDISDVKWMWPTMLLPLAALMRSEKGLKYVPPIKHEVAQYIDIVTAETSIARLRQRSYLPVVRLPIEQRDAGRILNIVYSLNANGKECGGENAFKYLIGEMVTNIYEHSRFDNAFVMAQRYSLGGFVDICFCDDGVSIPGSLASAGLLFEVDFEAVAEAMNGLSSKRNHERGWGIASSARICTEGLGGSLLIVSRRAVIEFRKGDPKRYIITERSKFSGTLISMRIPFPAPEVDIYEFTG